MKLQDSFGRKIRQLGRSPKTAKAYWYRIDQFIRWLYKKNGQWVHPKDVGKPEITDWLSHLANDQHVSPRTQNVALQALLFLYKQVLGIQIEGVNAIRAKAPKITIKDILSREEIAQLFAAMGDSTTRFCAQMLYGCGLRRGDLLQLRIKDLHFDRNQISIKDTKHGHQHWTMFPRSLHDTVRRQIRSVENVHKHDERLNPNGVSLPGAMCRKAPTFARRLEWYWLLPSDSLSRDPLDGHLKRFHRDAGNINRNLGNAAQKAGIRKRVTCHLLRHCWATHCHEAGVPIAKLQSMLGHSSIETTMTYIHADQFGATNARSPIDDLPDVA